MGKNKKKKNMNLVLYSKNSKEYQKLINPWEQKNYNVLLSGNKTKDDKVIRVNMDRNKIENTFYTALLYGINLNGMLDNKKKIYIERTMQEYLEKAQTYTSYFDTKIVSNQFLDLFEKYMKEQNNEIETLPILQLIFNLFKDEEIHEYFEGTFADENEHYNLFESEEELKQILLEIFSELKQTHILKIDKLRSYTNETKQSYKTLMDTSFNDFLEYFIKNVERKPKTFNLSNLEDNLELYYTLMEKDETLPNVVIINSDTLRLVQCQSFEKHIDPNRKCTVLFYFPESNDFERLVYESYFLPPFSFVENKDYILKKKKQEAFYRLYQFPYEHRLIQDLVSKKV